MKILMFTDSIAFGGGAERQFAGLACMLSESGYDVSVLTYYPDDGYKSQMTASGVNVMTKDFRSSQFSKLWNSRKIIKNISPDVIISFKDGANEIACILKYLGAKWRLIVSDRNTTQTLSRSVKLQYLLYSKADVIVPNSFSQKKFIERHFPKLSDKISVITNFTDIKRFYPDNTKKETRLKRIIVVGRRTEQKNVLRFIRSIKRLKSKTSQPFSIDWYGTIPEKTYWIECMKEYKSSGVGDVLKFHDYCENIEKIYPEFDMFCLPSIYEGFPNVLCEAMACGLPIVASKVCDNPLIVEEGKSGLLFNPFNEDDICDKLSKVLAMKCDDLNTMGKYARKRIVELCSPEAFINKYIALLK